VAATLVSVKWDGFGISQETWAFLIVIIALLITVLVIATRKDVAYGLVVIWALLGIAVKQSGNQNIVTTTEISAVVIVIALALSILISRLRARALIPTQPKKAVPRLARTFSKTLNAFSAQEEHGD
jgi:flagellar biosynthesis protein FliQ